jgi:kinetochor protein Mis14/NSL1
LERLKRDMPAAVAKMERARVAAGYVNGGGEKK